jgi:hypothetical protein
MAKTTEHRCEQHSWQKQLRIGVSNIHGKKLIISLSNIRGKKIEHQRHQHSWEKQLSIGVSNIHGKSKVLLWPHFSVALQMYFEKIESHPTS